MGKKSRDAGWLGRCYDDMNRSGVNTCEKNVLN
jgi:hypothetical protein